MTQHCSYGVRLSEIYSMVLISHDTRQVRLINRTGLPGKSYNKRLPQLNHNAILQALAVLTSI